MTKKSLKWLRQDEWQWAECYLRDRAPSELFLGIFGSPSHAKTTRIIERLGQNIDGLRLIERLKNALRQRRYRSPSNGRQACTFSLPNSTVKNLRRLAKAPSQSETLIVTELIDGLHSLTKEQQTKAKQLKEATQIEQKAAKQMNAMLKSQLDEVMNHLERHMELLVMWETSMNASQPPFDGDETDARREVDKRMKGIKRSLNIIALKHDIISERLI